MTAIVGVLAVKRILWLTKLISSGQPTADERGRKNHLGERIANQIKEVFGQTRLLRWSIPARRNSSPWGFFILATVYLEAYGVLFDPKFHLPLVGKWAILGFLQDFFAVAVLLGVIVFAIIRMRLSPRSTAASRFYGSHNGGAWLILFMIFNVIWTYALFRGSAVNNGNLPYNKAAFFSHGMAALKPLGEHGNEIMETVALLLHIGVMLVFLLIVLHPSTCTSAWHRSTSPLSAFPTRWARCCCRWSPGAPIINFEDPAEDAVFGHGKIEDFTWKGYLDLTTCTECGRCQSQCPAWNTGKPLSPKLLIMDLRDHLFAKAPYIFGDKNTTADALVDTEGGRR